jgi:NADPH:quinone reductase-like Zn-dependent oxidoreductase
MAKALQCEVFTTVGDDEKGEKARPSAPITWSTTGPSASRARFAPHQAQGVDVVFEHVGADTWNGSLLCLKRGGRLVTCGSTSGVSTTMNLMQLFQQQYRIFGSFGCRMENIAQSLAKMAAGPPGDRSGPSPRSFGGGLAKLEAARPFGKVIVTL